MEADIICNLLQVVTILLPERRFGFITNLFSDGYKMQYYSLAEHHQLDGAVAIQEKDHSKHPAAKLLQTKY